MAYSGHHQVFIRKSVSVYKFMRLCNNGEIMSSVVVVITTIKRHGWEGAGFCNVGIVLTWGAVLA